MKSPFMQSPRTIGTALLCLCVCLSKTLPAQTITPQIGGSQPAMPPAVQKAANQFDIALKFHRAQKVDEAIAAYKEYLRLVADAKMPAQTQVAAYENLSVLYRIKGNAKEMEAALLKVLSIEPTKATACADLASLYIGQPTKQEEARKYALKTLQLSPGDLVAAAAHYILGTVARGKNELAAAEKEFAATARLAPKNPQGYLSYGIMLALNKKYDTALVALHRALAINPKMSEAYFYIGAVKEQKRNIPEAILAYQEGLKHAPANPLLLLNLAAAQQRVGNRDEAISSYLRLLTVAKDNFSAHLNVADLYASLRNPTAARQHYAEAHRINPKEARALVGLANSELEEALLPNETAARNALIKQAEAHFKEAVALDPKNPVPQSNLAHFYERLAKYDNAAEIYQKLIAAAPNSLDAYQQLSNMYRMQRKPEAAVTLWHQYRTRKPDDPTSYVQTADLLEMQGKWLEASAEWKALLALKNIKSGLASSVLVVLAKDYVQAKQPKDARAQYEAVLKMDTSGAGIPKEFKAAEVATVQASRLDAMRGLSQMAQSDNNIEEAVTWMRKVKTEEADLAKRVNQPPNPQTYRDIARIYQQAKKFDLAIKELQELGQVYPKDAGVPDSIGQMYEAESRFEEAVTAYRRAAELAKDKLAPRLKIAEMYQRAAKLPLAIQEYESLQKTSPAEPRVLTPLAAAYRQAGRDEEALKTYDALLKADARSRWALDQKALILAHLKRYEEALAVYEEELKQDSQNRALYSSVAQLFTEQSKPEGFLAWVSPRFEKTPASPTLMSVVLDEHIRQKKEEAGWTYLRSIVDKQKNSRPAAEALALLLRQRNRPNEALLIYKQIAEQNPNDLTAQTTYAEQILISGRKEEAAKFYASLIARADLTAIQKAALRKQYARLLADSGDTAGEMVQLQEIVKADPNDFESMSTLVLRLTAAKRDAEALPLYQRLTEQKAYAPPIRAQLHDRMGEIYEKSGKKTEAANQFREALKLNPNDNTALEALKRLGT